MKSNEKATKDHKASRFLGRLGGTGWLSKANPKTAIEMFWRKVMLIRESKLQ